MARRIRIPWIVDLMIVDDANEILALVQNPNLDRDFALPAGPLINRLITARIRDGLMFEAGFLPAVATRGNQARVERQVRLEAQLSTAPAGSDDALATLAGYVNGGGSREQTAVTVQQLVGRLFSAEYGATPSSVEDANVLDGVGEVGVIRWFLWRLTGRVRRAKRDLLQLAKGDLHAVHGTAIAMHNIVRSLDIMRERRSNSGQQARLSEDRIVDQCLVAPRRVMRQATDEFESPIGGGRIRPGTLVLMSLDQARKQIPGGDISFMTERWSKCPAHSWVPSLLQAVWKKAEESRA